MDFKRMAGWAGILAVVFFVLSLILQGATPTPEDSVSDIGKYFAEDQGLHKLGLLFGVISAIPFLVFLGGFLPPFFRSDRDHGEGYGIVIFGGALLLGASATVGESAFGALLLRGGDGLDAPVVRGLYDLQQVAYGGTGIALAIFAAGVTIAVVRRGVMADWVGRASAVLAVVGPFGLFTMFNSTNLALLGFVPFLVFMVWLLAVSIHMVRPAAPRAG